jgi:hypothetical protein
MGTVSLSFSSATQTSISVSASYSGGSPSVKRVTFFIDSDSGSQQSSYDFALTANKSQSHTFSSGLSAGTQYKVYVRFYDINLAQAGSTDIQYFSTSSPPVPSTPSLSLNYVSGRDVSVQVSHGSNATNIDFDYYWTTGSVNASQVAIGTSTTHTFTVPEWGTQYQLDCRATNSSGASGWSSALTFTSGPAPQPPSTPNNIRRVSVAPTSMVLAWDSVSGANNYSVEVYRQGTTTNPVFTSYQQAGTSVNATGLSNFTPYDIKVYATNSNGNSAGGWLYNQSTTDGRPLTPNNLRRVSSTNVSLLIAWDSVSGATSYSVEAYRISTGALAFQKYGIAGTSVDVTGLLNYNAYDIKVYAVNSNGNSSDTWLRNQFTDDGIAPTVNINGSNGLGTMNVTYSASDVGSGLRTPNRYAVHIGTKDGGAGTTVHKEYTDNDFYTFTTDADGFGFVHNAKYWIKVYAYDFQGNSSGASVQVTYTAARPTNWAWHTSKDKGQPFSLTAVEWNSFQTKIDQFRVYKGYTPYPFTTAVKGQPILYTYFNEVKDAINIMSPPTSVPSTKIKGQEMSGADFNRLRDSLNSVV